MNLSGINITEVVERTKTQLQNDADASPALKALIELILLVVVLLAQRLGLNSQNSSIPPSKDSNRKKSSSKPSDKKAGGQMGHKGVILAPVDEPDAVKVLYPIFRIFFGILIIFPQIQSGQSTDASGLAGKIVIVKCQDRQTCRFNSTAYS
jgi:hypothetical protein